MKYTILLLTFCLFINSPIIFSQENWDLSNNPQELVNGANALVKYELMDISIEAQNAMKISYKRVVTVFNEKGNTAVQAGVGYDEFRKIKKIEAVVYDDQGNEIKKIKKKDFLDINAVDGGTLYSDSRILIMSYFPVTYPYTVNFYYEMENPNTAGIPSWRPINDYRVGIQKSEYKINDKAGLSLRSSATNLEEFNVISNNTNHTLHYEILDSKPIKQEDASPSLGDISPKVLVAVDRFHFNGVNGNGKDWKEFGSWIYHSLLKGRDEVLPKTRNEILSLTSGVDDPVEKAKIVYNYVQSNTRYISVQVGIGGIQPIPAIEVDKLKYGDCKGLTNYTQALLKIADVPSYYVVIEAGRNIVDFDTEFASLEQGNHIILAIPDKEDLLWMDCTSQIHPFGFIGDFTDNRNALLVGPEGGEIVKTVAYEEEDNFQACTATVNLTEKGNINGNITITTGGIQYDNRFTLEKASEDDVLSYYRNSWNYLNSVDIQDYVFKNDQEKVLFEEKIKVKADNYVAFAGESMLIMPNIFNRNTYIPSRYRNRKLPLSIQRGYIDTDKFLIKIPEGYKLETQLLPIDISNKFGSYQANFKVDGDILIYERKLKINKGDFSKSDYNSYRNFRKEISKADKTKLILKKRI